MKTILSVFSQNYRFIAILISLFVFSSATFSQISTNGLQLWLKSDAGVILNGSSVSTWQDQSGNGNDAIQSNVNRQPLFVDNELNGNPILRFDGSNDKLGFTGSTPMTQISFFVVIKQYQGTKNPDEEVPVTFGGTDMTLGKQYFFVTRNPSVSDPDNRIDVGFDPTHSAEASTNNIAAYDEWKNYSIVTDQTIWNTTIRWNGNDAAIMNVGSNASLSVILGDSLGRGGGIGGADNIPEATLAAKCDVAELIVYNRAVSDSEKTLVENYLNVKYNIVKESTSIPSSGLQLWLKSDTGVVLNGSSVNTWQDQSGNGNDAIQSNANRQPLFVNNELSGKPVIRFDGSNDKLGFTGSLPMTQISFFIVIKQYQGTKNPDEEVPVTFGGTDMTLGKQYFFVTRDPSTSNPDNVIAVGFDPNHSALVTEPNIAAYDQWNYFSVVTDQTIWNTSIKWNGKNVTASLVGSNASLSVPLGDGLGNGGGIGGADNVPEGTLAAICDVAELIVYNRAVSDSERSYIENYLSQKYNIITSVNDLAQNKVPNKFVLSQNYPNPFNPNTVIRFVIPKSSFVNLKVYDVLGREVATLVNEEKQPGAYEVNFDASGFSSGIYFYRLRAGGNYSATQKMVLLK